MNFRMAAAAHSAKTAVLLLVLLLLLFVFIFFLFSVIRHIRSLVGPFANSAKYRDVGGCCLHS